MQGIGERSAGDKVEIVRDLRILQRTGDRATRGMLSQIEPGQILATELKPRTAKRL